MRTRGTVLFKTRTQHHRMVRKCVTGEGREEGRREEGGRRRRRRSDAGHRLIQNEDPTPQDGWEKESLRRVPGELLVFKKTVSWGNTERSAGVIQNGQLG